MKLQNTLLFLLSVFVLFSMASPVIYAENSLSEKEIYNQAYDLSIRKDYQKAVEMLHKLLTLYPRTANEEVYWKLSQIYDENLYDYQKALEVYHIYLAKFPEGRFYANFRDRAAYLSKNRRDWDAIREYKRITDTSYTRAIKENIKLMLEMSKKYPQTAITPDSYNWLALMCQQTGQNKQALIFIKKYIGTFPANGKSDTEIIMAYEQYSTILASERQFKAAIDVLKKTLNYHISPVEYTENLNKLKKEQRIWIGLNISISYILLFLFLLLILKPWRETSFKFEPVRITKWVFLIILGTLLPMLGVLKAGYGIWKTFYGLTVMSSVCLVLIKLAAPVAGKLNRKVYLLICFLLIAAGIYLTYYWADSLSVFYQQPQY